MMVFVMDFLDKHTLLDHELVGEGDVSNAIAEGLGEFMGKTHGKTHSSQVSKERFDYLTNLQQKIVKNPLYDSSNTKLETFSIKLCISSVYVKCKILYMNIALLVALC